MRTRDAYKKMEQSVLEKTAARTAYTSRKIAEMMKEKKLDPESLRRDIDALKEDVKKLREELEALRKR